MTPNTLIFIPLRNYVFSRLSILLAIIKYQLNYIFAQHGYDPSSQFNVVDY